MRQTRVPRRRNASQPPLFRQKLGAMNLPGALDLSTKVVKPRQSVLFSKATSCRTGNADKTCSQKQHAGWFRYRGSYTANPYLRQILDV